MSDQISLFDTIAENNRNEAIPLFCKHQIIFILSLDVVLKGTVDHFWVCGGEDDDPYFGYSVDLAKGGHTVVWDQNVGSTVFGSCAEAETAATKIAPLIVKITPKDITAHDVRSFGYRRSCDGYELTSIIAKVGETQLYEKGFMCYHFLRTYKSKAERDKEYKTALNKAISEAEWNRGVDLENPPYEVLYRVTKDLYASREYALCHGAEYAALKRPKP